MYHWKIQNHVNCFCCGVFDEIYNATKIVSPGNEILRIDPVTFNIKKLRDEYENVLLSYL